MRALVTGCAGFIGSHLVDSLLHDGHEVVGADCFADSYARGAKLANLRRALDVDRFALADVDLADGDVRGLVEGADVVFHLAAEPGVRSSWGGRFPRYLRANVLATQRLLETLREGSRVVVASSSSVYGSALSHPTREDAPVAPESPYGVTKLATEQLCHAYAANRGLAITQLRLFSVFGPRQRPDMAFARFCAALRTGTPVELYGDGGQRRDFTYVGDVVAAFRAAAITPAAAGRTLNVGGGACIRLDAALDALFLVAGTRVEVRRLGAVAGDVRHTSAAIRAAAELLGYRPRVRLEEGLAAQWQWATGETRAALA